MRPAGVPVVHSVFGGERCTLKLVQFTSEALGHLPWSSGVGGTAPEGAAALWRLKVSLIRVQALLARWAPALLGAWSVSSNANSVWDCLSQLLDRCGAAHGQGLMGMEVTGQVVHAAHASLLAGLAQVRHGLLCICLACADDSSDADTVAGLTACAGAGAGAGAGAATMMIMMMIRGGGGAWLIGARQGQALS
eukprot:1160837-Pelagomonas_calceolata.AAC.9